MTITTTTTPEKHLLALYLPIRDRIEAYDREWIDNALLSGTRADIDDATQYCRGFLDEVKRAHAEKEA